MRDAADALGLTTDPARAAVLPAPRKTTTVPKILRLGRKGRRRSDAWRNR